MEMEKLIARINELANKKKTEGLTPTELEEQATLCLFYSLIEVYLYSI